MIPFQLLLKPAGADCNLDCRYCFYRKTSRLFPGNVHPRMNRQVLEEIIRQYLKFRFPVSVFSWQGGEPTLCGLSFFKEAVRLQQKHGREGQIVNNSVQTNGLLLDEEWCRFFAEYKFFVGLSLDGPADLHNRYRGSSQRKGMEAAAALSRSGVEFNILTVLTADSAGRARQLFHWFLQNGFYHLQFIPCLEPVPEERKIASFSISAGEYGNFLCELFDAWWDNGDWNVTVRTFESVLEILAYGKTHYCVFSPLCAGYLVVEHNGSLYPCDFFVRKETFLGNLLQQPLAEIYRSSGGKNFSARKSDLPEDCQECKWLRFCYGGCQKDRIAPGGGPARKTYFCPAYKQFFSHTMERFKLLATQISS